jgi:hypothetical protein
MASPDEDFVEMVAVMLMEGKEGYQAILDCETNANSLAIIRKKEQLVVQYYKESFNIDFYALQDAVQEAINTIAPPDEDPEELPPLFDQWGFDKEKKTVRFDLSMLNEPTEFAARFNQDRARMYNGGYSLDPNFKLYFSSEEELTLRMYYYALDDEDRVNWKLVPPDHSSPIGNLQLTGYKHARGNRSWDFSPKTLQTISASACWKTKRIEHHDKT